MIQLLINKAWQNNSPCLKLLRPLSFLYKCISVAKKRAYFSGKKPRMQINRPVLVVGNISVGGAGKTPLVIALVNYCRNKGIVVGVLSRGFGRKDGMVRLVDKNSTPNLVGDEPCLIVQQTGVPMAVGKNRAVAAKKLLDAYPDIAFFILDDGMQHYAIKEDAIFAVVDAERGFGNQKLLPEGFLREPIEALSRAFVVYHYQHRQHLHQTMCIVRKHTNNKTLNNSAYDTKSADMMHNNAAQHSMHNHAAYSNTNIDDDVCIKKIATMQLQKAPLYALHPKHRHQLPCSDQTVCAITGIGYPERFFLALEDDFDDVLRIAKNDHHHFVLQDFADFKQYPIIITEKDAVKVRHIAGIAAYDIWVLPVDAMLSDAVYQKMDEFLRTHGIIGCDDI